MLRLRDIMTTEVITVSPDMGVRDAMMLLAGRHVSGAPVVSGGNVVGVVTASDLLDFVASLPGTPVERADQTEWGAWAQVEDEDDRAEPVANEDMPSALYFTELWADAGADVDVRFASVSGPEWSALDEHTISEVMTRSPIWQVSASTPVPTAADLMRQHNIHRLLVVDDQKLLGIVTTTDIAQAVADNRLTARTYVFDAENRFDRRR